MPKQLPRRFLRRHAPFQFFDPNLSAAVAKSLGEQLVVAGNGYTLKHVVLGMAQGRLGASWGEFHLYAVSPHLCQLGAFLIGNPAPLVKPNLFRRDLDQLVSSGLTHQNGNFVVGRVSARFLHKRPNRVVSLPASLAESGQQFLGNSADLESVVPAAMVSAAIDVVSEAEDVRGQSI